MIEPSPVPTITDLLLLAYELEASDLHIAAGAAPMLRVHGQLVPQGSAKVTTAQAEKMARMLLGTERLVQFHDRGEVTFAYELGDFGRFRVNVYKQFGAISISVRVIPLQLPTIRKLGLPYSVELLIQRTQGLILVSGPASSGKSTTIAAMIDRINRTSSRHIVSLEKPIEFVHQPITSLVQHREIGIDAGTYACAIEAAVRQDCDVIVVDTIEDQETLQAVLMAVESGHLVIASVSSSNTIQAIEHVIEMYPEQLQAKARMKLSIGLAGVISQRLFIHADGQGRSCATEVLLATPAVADLIRLNEANQLVKVMQTGDGIGMHTMEMSISKLIEEGLLDMRAVDSCFGYKQQAEGPSYV